MRVVSGLYKGKQLAGFNIDGTRPTMDRVKESLFGSIQNYLENSVCLDLFAGSGSLGIEALSNGAKKCYFVDHNREIIKILETNLNGIKNSVLIKDDYKNALKKINEKLDIIFLDPPYQANLIKPSIKELIELDLLNDNALIICEYQHEVIDLPFKLLKEKKYGDKNIKIYKKMS